MSDINTFNNVNLQNNFIADAKVNTPSAAQDIVNKEYVDKKIEGMVSGVFWNNLRSTTSIINTTITLQTFLNTLYGDTTHTVTDLNKDLQKLSINTPLYICYKLSKDVSSSVSTCNYGLLNYNESSTEPVHCSSLNLKYDLPLPSAIYNTQITLHILFNNESVTITEDNRIVLSLGEYTDNNETNPMTTKSGYDLYQMILNRKADPVGDTLPVGSVVEYASDTIPENWLLCDGRAVSRTTYAQLFKVIGTTWGVGDGSTTFNLPSKLGLVTVGKNSNDTSFKTLNTKGGNKTTTLTSEQLPVHTHSIPAHSHGLNSHTHTYSKSSTTSGSTILTIDQIPAHSHKQRVSSNSGNQAVRKDYVADQNCSIYDQGCNTGSTGGGKGHTHTITLTSTNTGASSGNTANSSELTTGNGPGKATAFSNLPPYVTSNFIIKAANSTPVMGSVVDNLTSTSTTNALSANQGKILNEKIINNEPVLIKYGIVNNTTLKTATSNQQFLDAMGFTNTTQLKNALDKIYNKVPVLFTDISSSLYIIDITPVNLVLNKNTSYPVGYSSFTFRAYSNQTLYEVTIKFTTSNSTVWTYTCTEVGAVVKVEDSLTSSDPKIALSANQGKILKGLVDKTEEVQISTTKPTNTNIELWIDTTQDSPIVTNVIDNLTSTDTKSALSANQGKILNDKKLNLTGGTLTGHLYLNGIKDSSLESTTSIIFGNSTTKYSCIRANRLGNIVLSNSLTDNTFGVALYTDYKLWAPLANKTIGLGSKELQWNDIYSTKGHIGELTMYTGSTNATINFTDKTNPRVTFSNSDGSQAVSLVFTDHDSYKAPYGLTLIGNGQSTTNNGAYLKVEGYIYSSKVVSDKLETSLDTSTHLSGNTGKAIINSTIAGSSYQTLYRKKSTNGVFTINGWTDNMLLAYTADTLINDNKNQISKGIQFSEDGSLKPWNNNTQSLGTSDRKWSNVYATTFTGNLSGNASTATKLQTDINVQLSGDVTSNVTKMDSNNKISISTYRKGGCVGQSGNTTTKPWYKFASCTLDGAYSDRNIVFNVYQGYGDASAKVGILIAHFRTNSNKIWESGELRWLIKTTQMPVSDFILAHNTTAPCVVELWCKCPNTYTGYHFDVISEGDRSNRGNYWTLHTNFSAGSQDAITSGYKQITSTVNKQSIEINTRNTTDTWIPVLKGGELQYTTRVFATGKTHTNHNTEQDRIPTLSFLSFWNGAYNSGNSSNLTYCYQGEIQAKPKTLYNNNSGTTGTVTLSETSANFSYLEIFFSEKNYPTTGFKHEKVFAPNGKQVILSWSTHDDGTIIFRSARYSISGTSITRVSETQYNTWNKITQKGTETSIFRVLGYR